MNLFWYTQITRLLLPLFFLRLWWRGRHQPDYRLHWSERLGFYPQRRDPRPLIWVHAVSVGETRAALPLLHALHRRYPDHALLLTHTTPTGRATAIDDMPDGVLRVYLPYDLPGAVGSFLDTFCPSQGLLLETELWPRLIRECRQRRVPLSLVNARLSERSARRYALFPILTRNMLQQLTLIATQSPADAERFRALGAPTAPVMGNLKFDAIPSAQHNQNVAHLGALIGQGRRVWIAASTREGEEQWLLERVHGQLTPPNLLVLVPRHPQRFDAVARLLDERNLAYQRRSAEQPVSPATAVLLGDSMGEMNAWYQWARFALMGGTLLPVGGQNLLEPLSVGCPVLIGPHTYNFAAAAEGALSHGAARRVSMDDLPDVIPALLDQPDLCHSMGQKGLAWVDQERGATERLMGLLANVV